MNGIPNDNPAREILERRAAIYWRLEDCIDTSDALGFRFREIHHDFRHLQLTPDDAEDLIEETWDELVPPCERTRQQYAADLVRRWEAEDNRSPAQRRKDAEFTASKYWLVSRDGVASPAQLQRMIDGWEHDRRAKYGPPAATIEAYKHVRANENAAYLKAWLQWHPEVSAWLRRGGK